MAQRKKTAKRKAAPRKKRPRVAARGATALERIESELPATLKEYGKRLRRALTRLEVDIERGEKRARRTATRLLREASHQLGALEARGEREWKRRTTQARREAVRLLRKVEKAIEPPNRKARTRKTGIGRKKPAAAKTAQPTRPKSSAAAPPRDVESPRPVASPSSLL